MVFFTMPSINCRCELSEVRRSRDAWASHSTLQSTAVQQLQRENHHLKETLSHQHHKDHPGREEGQTRSGESDAERDQAKLGAYLESVEKELFETSSQLKAKVHIYVITHTSHGFWITHHSTVHRAGCSLCLPRQENEENACPTGKPGLAGGTT